MYIKASKVKISLDADESPKDSLNLKVDSIRLGQCLLINLKCN